LGAVTLRVEQPVTDPSPKITETAIKCKKRNHRLGKKGEREAKLFLGGVAEGRVEILEPGTRSVRIRR